MKATTRLFITLAAIFLAACSGNNSGDGKETPPVKTPEIRADIPVFNEDSAYLFVKQQVDMGPRVPGTDAHARCAGWLADKLKEYGAEVTVQTAKLRVYNGDVFTAKNIIGVINPQAQVRILLCAHWDSRPYADHDPDEANHRKPVDGANDGASGVGVLLEIARVLKARPATVGVDIIFFDLEDYGEPQFDKGNYPQETWGLGSQHWAKNPHVMNYTARYGILLDMVGVPDANFAQEGFSKYYAPDVLKKVWNAASRAGYGKYFTEAEGGTVNDDHLYINKYIKIPTIDIIHHDPASRSGFFKYWHTVNDNMDHIDKATLKAVGQTLLTVIYEEMPPA